ncbi:MAG TPA: gliding motility-associated C-terminal domain-containing protein, partial [Chitinophagaceae bacterium]|nr:gliding motility-associated C-terminal domain-containing protein [Chitinophagaceae bacterium]
VECSDNRVYIPSAFTPNGDGLNDRFEIKGGILIKHIVIYGRWGNVIYEKENIWASSNTEWWDGTYKRIPCDMGTYIYIMKIQCPSGALFIRKGTVVLIR